MYSKGVRDQTGVREHQYTPSSVYLARTSKQKLRGVTLGSINTSPHLFISPEGAGGFVVTKGVEGII